LIDILEYALSMSLILKEVSTVLIAILIHQNTVSFPQHPRHLKRSLILIAIGVLHAAITGEPILELTLEQVATPEHDDAHTIELVVLKAARVLHDLLLVVDGF
jgi:hypothetical protein